MFLFCSWDKIPGQKAASREESIGLRVLGFIPLLWKKPRQELEAASHVHSYRQRDVNACMLPALLTFTFQY